MIIRFDGTEIGGNYIAGIVKNAKVYDGVFKLGSTICEAYKLSINKDGISSIPQVVTISTNEYTLSGGNHLYIEGATIDDLVDYSVDGATEQKTYSGKNLFNINADFSSGTYHATRTMSENNLIITPNGAYARIEYSFPNLVAGNKYTLTAYYNNPNSNSLRIAIFNSGTEQSSTSVTTNASGNYKHTFTANADTRIRFYANTLNSTVTTPMTYYNIQLEEGTEETSYEPYVGGTPSPNPDFPQEVKTIPSIINLFDKANTEWVRNNNSNYQSTSNTNTTRIRTQNLIKLEGGKTYTLSGIPSGITINSIKFYANIGDTSVTSSVTTATFTVPTNATYVIFQFGGSNFTDETNTLMANTNFMLEEGSVAHEYVPYGYWSKVKVTGKNIFDDDISNLKYSNSNNVLTQITNGVRATFTGTSSSINRYSVMLIKDSSKLLGKTYSLSGVISPSASNRGAIRIYQIKSDGSVSGGVVADTSTSNTFTFPSTFRSDAVGFGILFYSNTDGTVAQNDYVDYTNIQLEEGNQVTPFEECKENITLIDMSKPNLIDLDSLTFRNGYYGSNGVWYTGNNNGIIEFIKVSPNTIYTITKNATTQNIGICEFNESKTFIQRTQITSTAVGGNKVYIFTTTSTTEYLAIQYNYDGSTTVTKSLIETLQPALYESNNPTPYYELCGIGDYKDILSVSSSGNVVVNKNVGKVVLNGSENWTVSSLATNTWYSPTTNAYNPTTTDTNLYAMSSNFERKYRNNIGTSNYGIAISNSGTGKGNFLLRNTDISSVSNFKTWLSTHNTDVYYVLATPETITLPNATIQLFDGINHITFIDDLTTNTTIVHKTPIKTLYTTDYDDKNDFTYEIQTEDAMTKFNFKYDASPIMTHTKTVEGQTINYAYLSEILDDICNKAGVTNGISSFYQDDMEVSWYNDTYMARDYLGFIGEINGKNLCISPRNELVFKVIKTTPTKFINFNNVSDFKIGAEHTITRVVWDNGINKWEYGNETGETYYINTDNVYVIDTSIVEHIYNEINGLDYYNFKTTNCPLDELKIGDIVRFTDGTNNYDTFTQFNNASFSKDSWFGGIELNVDSEAKQETQVLGQKENIREIKQTLDRTNNTVSTLVTETGEISTAVETLQTNTYTKTQVQRIVDGTGVDGVKVTKVETISGTFDIDGMHYAKSGAETESTINQYGVDVTRTEDDEQLLFAGYDTTLKKAIVTSEHLITRRYLSIGENSRLQDYKTGGGVWVI